MPSSEDTIRDAVIAKLQEEFGKPECDSDVYRWSVRPGGLHLPINITVNCVKHPNDVRVWVFNPRIGEVERSVTNFHVTDWDAIPNVAAQIHEEVLAASKISG